MNLSLNEPEFALAPGEVATLDDACGAAIRAHGGALWITEEGVLEDFVVAPGESFVVRRDGRTLVQAIEAAWITVREHASPCPPATCH